MRRKCRLPVSGRDVDDKALALAVEDAGEGVAYDFVVRSAGPFVTAHPEKHQPGIEIKVGPRQLGFDKLAVSLHFSGLYSLPIFPYPCYRLGVVALMRDY